MIAYTARSQVFEHFNYYDTDETQIKEIIEISIKDSTLNGSYRSFFQNGVTKAEGFYRDNSPDSLWVYYFQNGNKKAVGQLERGKQSGLWKYYYEYGGLKAEGNLKRGIRHGEWVNYFENEIVKSTGEYDNATKDGIWNFYFEDGTLKAQAFYRAGSGTYTEFYHSGKIRLEGENKNEQSFGSWTYYYESGEVQGIGNYLNGERQGEWVFHHPNGQKSAQGTYQKGLKSGEWQYWHDNGALSSIGSLKAGQEQGLWNLYFADGGLKSKGEYNDGEGQILEYYPGGQILAKGLIRNGNKEGQWIYFDEEGNQEGEAEFSNGIGKFTGYYENDTIRITGELENNKRIGLWIMYDTEGKIEGKYRPIYEEDAPVYRINEINEQNAERLSYDKPEYKFKAKSNRYFDTRINEYKGFIFSFNPFLTAFNELPLGIEYYKQERLGYELLYSLIRNPFYTSNTNIQKFTPYARGHQLKFKQKLYSPDHGRGMIYFGHELNFLWKRHLVKEEDQTVLPFEDINVVANETAAAYGIFLGYRWMSDPGGPGITLDVFIGVDIGYRSWNPQYEPNPDYDSYFMNINQNDLYLPFEFGLQFGFAGSNQQKLTPRYEQ
jgi:antitoxin component YwqK of YwqJK toxin-antitoxin module